VASRGSGRHVGEAAERDETGAVQARFRPRSNLSRALLPVVGGLAFFGLLALATWGIASVMSRNPDQVENRLAATVFEVGNTEFVANLIAEDGPILFQGLIGDSADRSVVLNHTGDDPGRLWTVRYAFPADGDAMLAVPERVRPIVSGNVISLDLRGAAEDAGETDTTSGTSGTSGTTAPSTTSD
jgi:hypothetical protein